MPTRFSTALLILASLLFAGVARAQVSISVRGGAEAEVRPGGVVTRAVVLSAGGEAADVALAVDLPEGWRLTLPVRPVSLSPGASATRLLSLVVPSGAPARLVPVRLEARAPDGSALAEATLAVRIRPLLRLALDLTDAPTFVRAGDTYEARASLENTGTAALDVRLSAPSRLGFVVRVEPRHVRLGPGDRREIVATVGTPAGLMQRRTHDLRVAASATSAEADTVAATTSASVAVVPRPDALLAAPRWPLRVTFSAATGERGSAVQIGLEGSGTLVEGQSRILEVEARAPGAEGQSALLDPDVYTLRYSTSRLRLEAGDFSAPGTALGVPTQQGLGAGAAVEVGGVTVSAFAQEARRRPFRERTGGAGVAREWGERWSVEGSIRRREDALETSTGAVVLGRAHLHRLAEIEVEVGAGERSPTFAGGIPLGAVAGDDGLSGAFRVRARGQDERGSYSAEVLRAGPNHSSNYFGTTQGSLLAWLRLNNAWQVGVSGSAQQRAYRRFDGVTLRRSADALRSTLTYRRLGALRVSASVGGEMRRQQTATTPERPRTERAETALRATATAGRRAWSVDARSELRLTRENIDQALGASARRGHLVRLGLRGRVSQRRYAGSLGVQYAEGQPLSGGRLGSLYLTASGQRLGQRLRLSASVTGGREIAFLPGEPALWIGSAEARARYALPRGHQVEAELRLARVQVRGEGSVPEAALRYSVPLGLPIVRAENTGVTVGGTLTDAANGAPLAGVLVSAGPGTALTESDGTFRLVLPPGEHYLVVDPRSLGAGRVVMQPMPLDLVVDVTSPPPRLALEVDEAATLRGRVVLYEAARRLRAGEPADSSAYREIGGIEGALVEVADSLGRYRALSDRQGRFFFTGLRPGAWTVRILRADLPANHALDEERADVVLAPGGEETAVFAVRPQQRRIRFVRPGGNAP